MTVDIGKLPDVVKPILNVEMIISAMMEKGSVLCRPLLPENRKK
jgi:hypothetical protein